MTKNMNKWSTVVGALVLVVTAGPAVGQLPVIASFGSNGELACRNLQPGTAASVEWAPAATGPWTNTWTGLDALSVDANGKVRVSVPMFYRVRGVARTNILEDFTSSPIYTNNFHIVRNLGSTMVTCTTNNLRLQASRSAPFPPGSSVDMLSNDTFSGDTDYSVQLNHQGKGRTGIGLWSVSGNDWAALTVLDTDDTDYLAFGAGSFSTDWKYPGSPYMNRWITLRIKIVGNSVQFFADGVLLETTSIASPGLLRAGFWVSTVPWKSGDNDTSFRLLSITGTMN